MDRAGPGADPLLVKNKFPLCLSHTDTEFSVASKNVQTVEPIQESRSAAFSGPRLFQQAASQKGFLANYFGRLLDSSRGTVGAPAHGLEVQIRRDAVLSRPRPPGRLSAAPSSSGVHSPPWLSCCCAALPDWPAWTPSARPGIWHSPVFTSSRLGPHGR